MKCLKLVNAHSIEVFDNPCRSLRLEFWWYFPFK